MNRRFAWLLLGLVGCAVLASGGFQLARDNVLRERILHETDRFELPLEALLFFPDFGGPDARAERISVALVAVARGLTRPTDLTFLPAPSSELVVLEQSGEVVRVDMASGKRTRWFSVRVNHGANEQGLLGIALHPRFAENGRLFVDYTADEAGRTYSYVSELRAPDPATLRQEPRLVRHVLRVEQPYVNHNGGCLRFGPDGMLYIGFGDGGAGSDPHGHGQDGKTLLGSILRVDVDAEAPPLSYRIPLDNPFLQRADIAPETFALGVRNPWRFAFAPNGRMVVADVGQNTWEELSYAVAGDNLGWNRMEGLVCFGREDCDKTGLRLPFHVYAHDRGMSITGGEVSLADAPKALRGLYVFGDYVSGRLWAMALPDDQHARAADRHARAQPYALGAWPVHPSTFARDAKGRVYVADHKRGIVYRIEQP